MVGPTQYRTRQPFAQFLPITEPEHTHHPTGIDGFRWSHRDALSAESFDEADEVAGQPVGRQRLGGSGSTDGHRRRRQFSRSSPAARTWSD